LFEVLAEDCCRKMGVFGALNLVNAIWSYAHMQHFHAPLFRLAQQYTPSVLNDMDSQLLGNLLWSFESVDAVDPEFFGGIITSLGKRKAEFWKPPSCAGKGC